MKMTLEELARASGMHPLRMREIMKSIQERRKMHRFAKNGWSYNKNSPWMATSIIPSRIWIYLRKKKKYFVDGQDDHEREKAEKEFLKDYPEFSARDSSNI